MPRVREQACIMEEHREQGVVGAWRCYHPVKAAGLGEARTVNDWVLEDC